ncbi:hypothetical protein POM88_035800 [Heracleum sosnowskyi]|uniref:Uncharacterized protein n=1 Tax=Heracleum sosnowskyi TaxID=360622 RepID=A0AAD8MF11_9APIA|nr:hypothetical protein POM88_035800 [Heracleum sosnowskyi]
MDKKYGVCFAVCFGFFSEENGYRQSVPYCLSESKISSVVVRSMDKKYVVENLLNELSSYHGAVIRQMKQMVELYIKLAELETKEVPVVTSTFPIDRSCSYHEGSFAHFKGSSDGNKYRQLAKSGNADLRPIYASGINISHAFFGTFWLIQYEKLLGVLETGIFPYFMMVHYVLFTGSARWDAKDFNLKLKASKQELLFSMYHASEESTEYIYTAVVKLQIGLVLIQMEHNTERQQLSSEPVIPTADQLSWLYVEWSCIKRLPIAYEFVGTNLRQLHVRVKNYHRLLQLCMSLSPSLLAREITQNNLYLIGRIEEAKLLRAQGQHEMAINLTKYINMNLRTMFLPLTCDYGAARGLYWEKYLKHAIKELEALIRRLKSSSKGDKTDYSIKIQELQKQLPMDREEAEQLQAIFPFDLKLISFVSCYLILSSLPELFSARPIFNTICHCLVIGDKYDIRVVPVVTSTFPIDRSCSYHEGSFAHFKGLADSVTVMNGINISHAFFGTFWLMQYEKLLGVLETGIFPYFMMVHYVVIHVHKLEVIILMKIYTVQEGDAKDFNLKLKASKQELLFSMYHASEESTEYIYTAVVKLQIGLVLIQRSSLSEEMEHNTERQQLSSEPVIPTADQLSWLYVEWSCIKRLPIAYEFVGTNLRQLHVRVKNYHRLLQLCMSLSPSLLAREITQNNLYLIGRIEEAKLLRAQGQHEMAINLTKYINMNLRTMFLPLTCDYGAARGLYWEKYLKHAVTLAEDHMTTDKKSMGRQSQTHCYLAHYADALLRNCEERLNSNEWQAAMQRLKSSSKGDKTDYSIKIQELQKQLPMDREEAEQLQAIFPFDLKLISFVSCYLILSSLPELFSARPIFNTICHCLVIGDKYDIRVVFRLISLWFSLLTKPIVVNAMLSTIIEGSMNFNTLLKSYYLVPSYKFIPLVYQIASRLGGPKDGQGAQSLQDTNKKVTLPRDIRSLRQLERVPVVTSTFPIDRSCQYHEGSFAHFKGLADSVTYVMNGMNAPKVVECLGSSDGNC